MGRWEPFQCGKHGVSIAEIEGLFSDTIRVVPDPAHSAGETRFRAIGKTPARRWVFLVFALRMRGERQLIRPISARYMHVREVKAYEEVADPDER